MFDGKKKILIGLLLLAIMYIFIYLGQPAGALIMAFAFFVTLGFYGFKK